ncbi:BMP family lipoprotein [Shinella sp.]|uniref:BMP family lipoprotein n=1 Tax=Shinella sp. TaxID=1870904 RepID=UPI003F714ED9
MLKSLLVTVAFAATIANASAADFNPAVVYGTSGKFDKSFNEMAYTGAEKFKADTGSSYRDFEAQADSQAEQGIRNFASRGFSPVIVTNFAYKDQLAKVAKEFPDVDFVMLDDVIDLPNVRSVTFKEEQGSYVVGLVAALTSESKTVGFIGGMDIPIIRKFGCGYAQGASAGGATNIIRNMTGTTGSAFNDPVKGGEIAASQMGQGADVIFAAAGGTGIGVLQKVADAGKLSVGVDSNQNYMHPGSVLTSMVKRVDVAVYNALMDAKDGKFTGGVQSLGLAENGVDWSLDEYNRKLITPEVEAAAKKAKDDIAAGTLKVHDYMSDDKCPL